MEKIITIDGPAGSGKSTIAKILANRIGYSYLDTGAIYRCITLYFMRKKIKANRINDLASELDSISIKIDQGRFFLGDDDVSDEIRSDEVTKESPFYAKVFEIREFVKKLQKRIAGSGDYVIDGRDIGSVVFKDAFCKFYLDASVKVRAKRRLSDRISKDEKTIEEVEKEVNERDIMDKTRNDSPLVIPMDAHLIDTTNLKVEEVLDKMIEEYNNDLSLLDGKLRDRGNSSIMFFDALENISGSSIKKGSIVKAKIANFLDNRVLLDMGDKKDGFIQGDEIEKIKENFKIDDEIVVYVIGVINNHSEILASHREANKRESMVKFTNYFEENKVVEGEIIRSNLEGFLVEIDEVKCFCYFNDYGDKNTFFIKDEIGKRKKFRIKLLNNSRILLTRLEIDREEREKAVTSFFEQYQEGDIVDVDVKRFLKYGIYVAYSECLGFIIRNKDISWKRFNAPKEFLEIGQKIRVKILEMDYEKKKVVLSKKEVDPNPIDMFFVTHKRGDVLEGKVHSFMDFGVFLELEPGVDGLLHVSEISWIEKVDDPGKLFKKGDILKVQILNMDKNRKKISLGYKQTQVNPWDEINEDNEVGKVVSLEVKDVSKGKVILKGDSQFDYILHYSNYTWKTNKKVNLQEYFEVSKRYDLKIIEHNRRDNYIEVGLKQMTENPWQDIRDNYGEGSRVKAKVTKLNENGAFVLLEGSPLEGFCHISQASRGKVEKIEDAFEVGKEYDFILQKIDELNNRLSFSAKAFLIMEEKGDMEKYMNQQDSNTYTLGDFFNTKKK